MAAAAIEYARNFQPGLYKMALLKLLHERLQHPTWGALPDSTTEHTVLEGMLDDAMAVVLPPNADSDKQKQHNLLRTMACAKAANEIRASLLGVATKQQALILVRGKLTAAAIREAQADKLLTQSQQQAVLEQKAEARQLIENTARTNGCPTFTLLLFTGETIAHEAKLDVEKHVVMAEASRSSNLKQLGFEPTARPSMHAITKNYQELMEEHQDNPDMLAKIEAAFEALHQEYAVHRDFVMDLPQDEVQATAELCSYVFHVDTTPFISSAKRTPADLERAYNRGRARTIREINYDQQLSGTDKTKMITAVNRLHAKAMCRADKHLEEFRTGTPETVAVTITPNPFQGNGRTS